MEISAISQGLLQQISNTATRSGDAVTVSVLRKAMDIQASQAAQLIQSVKQSAPDNSARLGRNLDIRA